MKTNDLTANLHKLHTTELGAMRVRRNLALDTADVLAWCRGQIENAGRLERRGKNWYAYTAGAVITINARSYTVITAHICKETDH